MRCSSSPSGRALDLYATRPGEGSARRLTRTPDSDELDPAASPDGRLIAYTRISLAHRGSRIWIARRDGSHRRFVTRGSEPAWSPDGKRIVFVGPRRPPEKPEIYTMRADGTHIQRLTRNAGASDRSPAWSPDGRRIAFLSNRNATGGPGKTEIWVMDTKGRHAVNLTHNAEINDHPAWSPDGSRILFERSLSGGVAGSGVADHVFVMNADGSDQHQVGTLDGSCPRGRRTASRSPSSRWATSSIPTARRSCVRTPTAAASGAWRGSAPGSGSRSAAGSTGACAEGDGP